MSELVERCVSAWLASETDTQRELLLPGVWEEMERHVRTIITTMREPTEGMVDAYAGLCGLGGDLCVPYNTSDGRCPEGETPLGYSVRAAWRAMIDEALR